MAETLARHISPERKPLAPRRVESERPNLQLVRRRAVRRRRRAAMSLSLFFIVGSLLSVVVGHSILAQGQIRLSAEEGAIAHAQTVHRHDLVAVARLANPQRIVSEATTKFNMTVPSHVTQVPYVNVTKPLTVSTSQPSATVTPTTNATASTAAQASGAATTK